MKKILPVVLLMIFVLTGIAAAQAPFHVLISITDAASTYSTSFFVRSGNQIAIKLGNTDVILNIEEKQEEGLNFSFDTMLQYNDEQYGIVDLKYFLLPENVENTFTEIGKDSPKLTVAWEHTEIPPIYARLIDQAAAVLKGTAEESENDEEDNFSVIFRMMSGRDGAENFGYYITDLDNDGTRELLFGENDPVNGKTVFYDLYTIRNGELLRVFDGWDRSRYYLVSNGGIAHEGSSSAFMSFTSLNYYVNGELHLMESVIYDSKADPVNPWHLSTISETEISDTDQLMDEAEAAYALSFYPYVQVELEPFIK